MPGDIDPNMLWRHIHELDKMEDSSSIENGFEEWPTLHVQLTQGARLSASNGKIVAVMGLDGHIQYMPGMEREQIISWESFGVFNPAEQVKLADKVNTLINSLANKDYR